MMIPLWVLTLFLGPILMFIYALIADRVKARRKRKDKLAQCKKLAAKAAMALTWDKPDELAATLNKLCELLV